MVLKRFELMMQIELPCGFVQSVDNYRDRTHLRSILQGSLQRVNQ